MKKVNIYSATCIYPLPFNDGRWVDLRLIEAYSQEEAEKMYDYLLKQEHKVPYKDFLVGQVEVYTSDDIKKETYDNQIPSIMYIDPYGGNPTVVFINNVIKESLDGTFEDMLNKLKELIEKFKVSEISYGKTVIGKILVSKLKPWLKEYDNEGKIKILD